MGDQVELTDRFGQPRSWWKTSCRSPVAARPDKDRCCAVKASRSRFIEKNLPPNVQHILEGYQICTLNPHTLLLRPEGDTLQTLQRVLQAIRQDHSSTIPRPCIGGAACIRILFHKLCRQLSRPVRFQALPKGRLPSLQYLAPPQDITRDRPGLIDAGRNVTFKAYCPVVQKGLTEHINEALRGVQFKKIPFRNDGNFHGELPLAVQRLD